LEVAGLGFSFMEAEVVGSTLGREKMNIERIPYSLYLTIFDFLVEQEFQVMSYLTALVKKRLYIQKEDLLIH
jgi:hypothetical protein